MTSELTIVRLESIDALAALETEWEAVDSGNVPRMPFTSPHWLILWWRHFRRCGTVFRDEFYGHVVRDATGRLIAVVPLMRTFFPGIGLPLLRIAQFFGTDPALTEVRGIVCRSDDHARVVRALTTHFAQKSREWDVFRWSGLRQIAAGEPGCDPMTWPSDIAARGSTPDYWIDLPSSWDEIRLRVSANMRKNIRKAYEMLKRDGVECKLRVFSRQDELPRALQHFFQLHDARCAAEDMVEHPNKFAESRPRAFLSEYLQGSADRGELRIFALEIEGSIVAIRPAFELGSDLYIYFSGYDPAWRDYSIMTVLMAEMMKWSISNGVERFNLSAGNDQSKTRWKPNTMLFHDGVQISSGLRARLAIPLFRVYEELIRRRLSKSSPANDLRSKPDRPRFLGNLWPIARRQPMAVGADDLEQVDPGLRATAMVRQKQKELFFRQFCF